ncbi:vacuolar alkaline phosphatase [Lecanora helva]
MSNGEICNYHPGEVCGGILADCTGLGKSLTVIAFIAMGWEESIKHSAPLSPTLLVVPSSLLQTWDVELEKHLHPETLQHWKHYGSKRIKHVVPMLAFDIVLTSYDTVAAEWRGLDRESKPLYSHTWQRIILDEAHEIRSDKSQRTKAVCALKANARWTVTATPLQNSWTDVMSLLNFLKVWPERDGRDLKRILGANASAAYIRSMISPICLRRRKDVIDLPSRIDEKHRLKFRHDETAHYNRQSRIIEADLDPAESTSLTACSNILTRINALRQICNLGLLYQDSDHRQHGKNSSSREAQKIFDGMLSAGLATCSKCSKDLLRYSVTDELPPGADDRHINSFPKLSQCGHLICTFCLTDSVNESGTKCKHQPPCQFFEVGVEHEVDVKSTTSVDEIRHLNRWPSKIEALKNDIVAIPEAEKSIVFSFWTSTLDLVGIALNQTGIRCTRVDGSMPPKLRQQALAALANDPHTRVLLISLRCGSTGYSSLASTASKSTDNDSLNLTSANNVFLMEPQWNPMLEEQALDRVYRIGQTKKVKTVRYIVQGTLEESVCEQQVQKRNLADQALTSARRHDDWTQLLRIHKKLSELSDIMTKDQQPLLAEDRPSSEQSSERHVEEEDALLTGQQRPQRSKYDGKFWREVGLFSWALIATAVVIVLAVLYQHKESSRPSGSDGGDTGSKPDGKRNMIFMVSDGMGPTSLSLTRSFRQSQMGLPVDSALVLDSHLIGSSRTRSTSSLITDSAAGATAFSCGKKSYNGAISVLPDHSPCGTVLEAAKEAGYMTGLVVTTRLTDATPACFAAHVNKREEEDRIAEQMIGEHPLGRVVDLMLGGGKCHFLANTTKGSCREDETDVIEMAKGKGFNYVGDRKGFDGLKVGSAVKLPLLGLFADLDIPYEVDRRNENEVYPSLDEMAQTALRALSEATKDSSQGFFLMIEGSRIDHAGHGNDPVAQVHEVVAYDKAFASVLDFFDKDDVEGVLVGTSDHETGGLATARQLHQTYPEYHWFPDMLVNATHSAEKLAYELHHHLKTHIAAASDATVAYIRHVLFEQGLGIYDASDDELHMLLNNSDPWPASFILADMISRRAQVGWTTHGHSAVDVNVYASNPKQARPLIGNHENTEIGDFIRQYLDVDLEAVTKQLKEKAAMLPDSMTWMGKSMEDNDSIVDIDHYHGDFKRSLDCNCNN